MNFKRTQVALGPFAGEASGNTIDWGGLVRVTPIDRSGSVPLRFSAAAGGIEATLVNVLTLRTGYCADHKGEIEDATFGFALALPVGRIAGARYEQASFPQAKNSGLDNLTRRSFTVWIDPLQAWALSHRSTTE